jgi:sulfur carrier protein ThiS
MRSVKEECVEEETTIGELLENLAKCYPIIAYRVFDRKVKGLYPDVLVTYNDRLITTNIHEQILREGDKITVLPVYMGG